MAVSPISFQDGNFSMEELLSQSEINTNEISTGKVITGKVVGFQPTNENPETIIVSMGTKSEGKISIREFVEKPKLGDEIEAIIKQIDKETGVAELSKRELEKRRGWEVVSEAYNDHKSVSGVVRRQMKSGYLVNIEGLNMFLPHSHVGNLSISAEGRRGGKKEIIDNIFNFKILELNQRKMTGVISRKEFLEEQNDKRWQEVSKTIEIGQVIKGTVVRHMISGAFIDVDGIEGFLHKTNISWERNNDNFRNKVAIGQEVEVRVLEVDVENHRLSLGLKQLTDNPWVSVEEKFELGDVVNGIVTYVANYGAFVEIGEGIEGLLHVSEMSWTRKINRAGEILKVGQEIEAVIIGINPEEKRISLGLKQLVENPWDSIEQKFAVGDVVHGKIKDITGFGIFVSLGDEIDALIRKEDVNWDEPPTEPSKLYKKGQEIDFKIIEINTEAKKIGASIRHLLPNPYKDLKAKYPRGTVVDGVVSGMVDFGIFVKIDNRFEGLVHVSAMSREQAENPKKNFQKGEQVRVVVRSIDPENRKISLSLKDVKYAVERAEIQQYISKDSGSPVTSNPFGNLKSFVFPGEDK